VNADVEVEGSGGVDKLLSGEVKVQHGLEVVTGCVSGDVSTTDIFRIGGDFSRSK